MLGLADESTFETQTLVQTTRALIPRRKAGSSAYRQYPSAIKAHPNVVNPVL